MNNALPANDPLRNLGQRTSRDLRESIISDQLNADSRIVFRLPEKKRAEK